MLQQLTKSKAQELRTDIQAALDAIAKKHGMKRIQLGKIGYEEFYLTAKIEGVLDPMAEGAQNYGAKRSNMLGLSENIMGRKYTDRGVEYQVCDILKSGKNRICLEDNKGNRYTANHVWIAKLLGVEIKSQSGRLTLTEL